MHRTAVNPWDWSLKFGYNQGEIIENSTRQLICAGQTAVNQYGQPQHPDDMLGQMRLAYNNLEAVLTKAQMTAHNITGLRLFTTDIDATLENFHVLGERLAAAAIAPPMTLLEVSRLAIPGLLFEIEATAAS
jgi:enamine deaminase RidA (YjgF/YER057c/UK114 family)